MSGFTKEIIARTFTELLEEKSMAKITVKDIVERCGVNRNTFYYHFRDIPDVVEFILKKYGFRVDTEKHAFLLRCNPTKGDYNFYCYCYVKEWLDKHIQKAEQGIRFIDPQYKELFRIPDGGKVIVTTSWGEKREYPCRFIDEYHTEVGSNLYHICEFAERMQKNGATYEPKSAEQTPQKTPKHKDLER